MTNKSIDAIFIVIFYIIGAIYLIDCLINTIENLELLGASMLAVKPSFTISATPIDCVTTSVYIPLSTEFLTMLKSSSLPRDSLETSTFI